MRELIMKKNGILTLLFAWASPVQGRCIRAI